MRDGSDFPPFEWVQWLPPLGFLLVGMFLVYEAFNPHARQWVRTRGRRAPLSGSPGVFASGDSTPKGWQPCPPPS